MTFLKNVPLKKHSNYKIGGSADYFFEFKTPQELIEAIKLWRASEPGNNNIFILGKATNVLFSDDGFRGLVLKDEINFIEKEGELVKAGSGTLMDDLVGFFAQNSMSGLEWAGGLPGTVGGAVRGNAGAFGGETKDNLAEVESLDPKTLEIKKRNKEECQFGYRQSVFKNGEGRGEIILSAKFRYKNGNKEEIKTKTQEKIDYRIDRHPLNLPNVGSTFKNVPLDKVPQKVRDEFKDNIKNDPFPILPVAKLLVACGLKEKSIGGAMISGKHPNFIVNFNNAKAQDVKALISLAKKEVKEKFDILLEEEILVM